MTGEITPRVISHTGGDLLTRRAWPRRHPRSQLKGLLMLMRSATLWFCQLWDGNCRRFRNYGAVAWLCGRRRLICWHKQHAVCVCVLSSIQYPEGSVWSWLMTVSHVIRLNGDCLLAQFNTIFVIYTQKCRPATNISTSPRSRAKLVLWCLMRLVEHTPHLNPI